MRGGRRRAGAAGCLAARPKLLLFDFDGTIADTFRSGLEILNLMAPEFGYRPLREEDLPRARDMRTGELMKFLGIPATRMAQISRRGKEELNKRMDRITPLPGMLELIRLLSAEGFRLAILTSNSEENVAAFLKKFEVEVFEFVHTASKLAGKGRVIRRILKSLHLDPKEILLIGDEVRDVEAAQETGVHMVAVTWGYNSRRALINCAPDYLVEEPEALLALVCEPLEELPSPR
jgi:phosphoglycolate phosphatase